MHDLQSSLYLAPSFKCGVLFKSDYGVFTSGDIEYWESFHVLKNGPMKNKTPHLNGSARYL